MLMKYRKVFQLLALVSSLTLVVLFLVYRGGYFDKAKEIDLIGETALSTDTMLLPRPPFNDTPRFSGTSLPGSKSTVPVVSYPLPTLKVKLFDTTLKRKPAIPDTRLSSSKSAIIADTGLLRLLKKDTPKH